MQGCFTLHLLPSYIVFHPFIQEWILFGKMLPVLFWKRVWWSMSTRLLFMTSFLRMAVPSWDPSFWHVNTIQMCFTVQYLCFYLFFISLPYGKHSSSCLHSPEDECFLEVLLQLILFATRPFYGLSVRCALHKSDMYGRGPCSASFSCVVSRWLVFKLPVGRFIPCVGPTARVPGCGDRSSHDSTSLSLSASVLSCAGSSHGFWPVWLTWICFIPPPLLRQPHSSADGGLMPYWAQLLG